MSLIERYTKNPPVECCDKCGDETESGYDFYGFHLCPECYKAATSPAVMAEYAMRYPGSWHVFLKENVLGAGDLTISEITDMALWYFEYIYAKWFIEDC